MAGDTAVRSSIGRSRASSPRSKTARLEPSSEKDVAHESGRACILLVDDDQAVLDTFARMLRLKGYDVSTAIKPETGLQEAERCHPDAIILDFRMPLLDGMAFLRRLRSLDNQRNTPTAIVTGDYFLDDAVTADLRELGALVLFKPLWLEQLVDLAKTLVTKNADQQSA